MGSLRPYKRTLLDVFIEWVFFISLQLNAFFLLYGQYLYGTCKTIMGLSFLEKSGSDKKPLTSSHFSRLIENVSLERLGGKLIIWWWSTLCLFNELIYFHFSAIRWLLGPSCAHQGWRFFVRWADCYDPNHYPFPFIGLFRIIHIN